MPYPPMLAEGITQEDAFVPFELWAGDAKIVSDQITAGAVALEQFRVYALDRNGNAIVWNPEAGKAAGTLTFGGQPTAADTLTINGVVTTFVAAITDATSQILIAATAALTAAATLAFINAHSDDLGVTAKANSSTVVGLLAVAEDEEGNAVTLAKSGTYPALSGANLTGGADYTAGEAVGFTAQPIAANGQGPSFVGGAPNWQALIVPAGVTLAQLKNAFAGKPIYPRLLL